MKTGRNKTEWLDAYQGFRKYLNQCVVCQEIGYDPVKIEKKEGLYFKEKVTEFFHPVTINEIGICDSCAARIADPNNHKQIRE
jgi:hypothetical protein